MFVLFLSCSIAIIVIWGGYPVFVALVATARRTGTRSARSGQVPVTVVIATAEPIEVVNARVRDVLEADYPTALLDVVVSVDYQAEWSDEARCLRDPRLHIVRGDAPGGKAAALNAGARHARGEILVFTDSAQRFDRSAVRTLVDALGDPELGAVSGALHLQMDAGSMSLPQRYWRYERWLRFQEAKLHSTVGVTGAVYALRRSCWQPLPAGLILDDVFVPMRVVLAGQRVGFEPAARAFDERRFSASQELRRKARTLTGVMQLCAWLPSVLVPWRNPIWGQFLFHKLLRLLTPYLLIGAAVGLAGWMSAFIARVAPQAGLPVMVGGVVCILLLIVANRSLRRTVHMAAALQLAVMRATLNGLRGEWDVWHR